MNRGLHGGNWESAIYTNVPHVIGLHLCHFCAPGSEEVRHLRSSVVTQICQDYGLIDDVIYFTSDQVLGGILLRLGDTVDGIAVRDGANGGWKALRVRTHFDWFPLRLSK